MKAGTDFTHVMMTRFNMATGGKESRLRNRPGWLERRFHLFETYCLPTIAAQDCRDFQWIIYFDEETPDQFRERIDECRKIQPFTPYYTANFGSEGWPRSIREVVNPQTPWLVTTRLDNDDGLANTYFSRLHARLADMSAPEHCAFNFTNGYVFHAGGRVYAHRHTSNAFASWLEPFDDKTRTALDIPHMELADHGKVLQIDGDGAWLQVIHDLNVSNKIRGRRVNPSEALRLFPRETLGALAQTSPAAIAFENTFMTPLRGFRDNLLGFYHALRK